MKRIITLAMLAVIVMTANAANRKWNFTQWSATTIAQVQSASDWTNDEKGDGSSNVVPNKACMWNTASSTSAACNADGYLMAGGAVIAELEGLKWTATAAKKIAMAFDYTITTDANKWGPYDGPSYLWLNGKTTAVHFTIPAVKPGATISIKCESHKPSEGRGIDIYVGGTKVAWTSGQAGYPTTADTYVWTVPESEEETVDVDVQPSNGTHIYFINVEEGGSADVDKNVAWISNDPSGDMYAVMRPTTGIAYTDIAASTTMTSEELRAYDAVVFSVDVPADAPMAKLVEDNIAYMPIVNLNTNLFGYTYGIVDKAVALDKDNDIFTGVELDENGNFEYVNVGVNATLPARFANDKILAMNGDAVLIHQHTPNRNSYILLASDNSYEAVNTAAWPTLLANAINIVAASKKKITNVSTPVITQQNNAGETTVTITCATPGATVMYAIDDAAFQVYTQPFTLTSEATIYAYATAEGYINMNEEEAVNLPIKIYTPAAAPTISYTDAEGVATITMSADADATIYYNFVGSSNIAESVAYTEPITLSENATITAFVAKEGYLNSATVSKDIEISGLKLMQKTLSHFSAAKADWSNGESKTYYYCYGYDDGTGTKYKKYNLSNDYTVTYCPEGSEWTLKTSGQQVVWENTSPQKKVGDTSNYNPVSITDLIGNEITGGEITFGTTASHEETLTASDGTDSIASVNDKPSAELISNVKFQAPFNILTYIGCKPGKSGFEYFVSTDGENWTSIATSPAGPTYDDSSSKWRLWHRDLISYNGTDEVYLKLKSISTDTYRIFDIFVKGEGSASGIKDITSTAADQTSVRKYCSNGQILIQTPRGTFTTTGARVK